MQNISRHCHTDSISLNLKKSKIKGAVRTDFILSAEIIVIALGTVKARRSEQMAVPRGMP